MGDTMKVNVLGSEYTIYFVEKTKDEILQNGNDGYCDHSVKKIVVEDFKKEKGALEDLGQYKNQVLRHELVHAFLHESGLDVCSWAKNEEMVDWIAIQIPKICEIMEEIKIL